MKELTIKDKAKAYDKAIERAKEYFNSPRTCFDIEQLCNIFPELTESDDEKIRGRLINLVKMSNEVGGFTLHKWEADEMIAWLEKQGSEPNWVHHNVDLSNCSEEYRKAYYDGWNNCNMQHSQCKSESDDVIKCLINGMKFYYETNKEATWGTDKWSMPVKHIIEVLGQILANSAKTCKDEQKPNPCDECVNRKGCINCENGELREIEQKPIDKVEPKFKVGDWIIHNKNIELANSLMLVIGKDDNEYLCNYRDGQYSYNIEFIDKEYRLWTIQDAKDGDVLFTSSTASHETFIFKSIDEKGNAKCYFTYDSEDGFREGKYHFIGSATNCKPATKEQCDLLFQKMKEAGYEWDAEKKELKKIEQKYTEWSENDEEMIIKICQNLYDYPRIKSPFDDESFNEAQKEVQFIKSLKDKMQPRQEWNGTEIAPPIDSDVCG